MEGLANEINSVRWVNVKLGEIAIYEKGKKPKSLSKEKNGKYVLPYVNIQAFEKGVIDEYTDGEGCVICNENDFLMVWDGSRSGYVGKAIYGAVGSTLVKINIPGIDNRYAYYFLKSKFLEINTKAKGTGTPHVDPNLLWNYQFPVAPLQEQNRIVEKIEELFSELDNSVEILKTIRQQLKVYRQSVLKWAFEGKLTEQWREKNKAIQIINESNSDQSDLKSDLIHNIPISWKWITLGHYSEVTGGLTKNKNRDSYTNKFPYLRVANVYENRFVLDDIHIIGVKESELSRVLLREGDLLFVEGNGSIQQIGRVAIWNGEIENCVHQNHLIKVRCNEVLFNKYVLYFYMSLSGRKLIEEQASSTSGLNTLSISKVMNLKLPFTLLKEQELIVQEIESRLSICDKLEETVEQSLKQAGLLRQSILKKAFKGKLVPQDPNDESTEVLLERIRNMREEKSGKAATKLKPKRRK